MADHTNDHTNTHVVSERVETKSGGGSGLAFIVGGLVVAVLVIAWLFTGGDFGVNDGSSGGQTNINVDAPAVEAPAPAADAPAPAAEAPAPAN